MSEQHQQQSSHSSEGYRRVVTGLNEQGQSSVILDGPVSGTPVVAWRTKTVPADNSGSNDIDVPQFGFDLMHDGGSNFLVSECPPGVEIALHATDTIDYVVMMRGEIVLLLESGETLLKAGDLLVDRGVLHGWRNDGGETAVMAVITLPAHPVGKGRTV